MTSSLSIAVAVPAYQRPDFLTKLVDSVPSHIPMVVSDNNASLADASLNFRPNVKISASPSLIPMFANWNRALSLVADHHTHVLIPSDDDLYLPGAFDCLAKHIAANPQADIFIFGCDLVDEFGSIRKGYAPRKLQYYETGAGFSVFECGVDARMPGVMFRKEFLQRIGAFDEKFRLTAADSELVQRALLLGTALFVPEVVGLYRVWQGSLTHTRQATDEWVREVKLWTDKISILLSSGAGAAQKPVNVARYGDEILARNLVAGVRGLLERKQMAEAAAFLGRHATPPAASFRTRSQLALCRFAEWRGRVR